MDAVLAPITLGPARYYVGLPDADLPAAPADRAALETLVADLKAGNQTGFSYLGNTTAAAQIVATPTVQRVGNSQQTGRDLGAAVTKNDIVISSTASEYTAAALANWTRGTKTVAGTGDTAVSTVTPGGIGMVPVFPLIVVGPDANGREIVHVFERCGFESATTITYDATAETNVPFEIAVYGGVTLPEGWVTYMAEA